MKRKIPVIMLILMLPFAVGADDVECTGCVNNSDIGYKAVSNSKIGKYAVSQSKIKAGAVSNSKIGKYAVSQSKIRMGSVSNSKIGKYAVSQSKIRAGAVSNSKIRANAVSTSKIRDGAITLDKLSVEALASLTNTEGSEGSEGVEDRFNYSYSQVNLPAGTMVTIAGNEYEVASLKDHSIFTVKVPVLPYYSSNTPSNPYYGVEIRISGEDNYGIRFENTSIDNYDAHINYNTTVEYASALKNQSSPTKAEFDSDGPLKSAQVYSSYLTVKKENFSITCQSTDVDLTSLPDNLWFTDIEYDLNRMTENMHGAFGTSEPISYLYDQLVTDCVNSDNYLRQEYAISTTLWVHVTVALDSDTRFSLSTSTKMENDIPRATVMGTQRNFDGTINVQAEVPNPNKRHYVRQEMLTLPNHIVITKK